MYLVLQVLLLVAFILIWTLSSVEYYFPCSTTGSLSTWHLCVFVTFFFVNIISVPKLCKLHEAFF